MRIAFASAEMYPFAKTGGLGDVVGSLPKALAQYGCEVKVFIPKYALIDHAKYDLDYIWAIGEMPVRVAGHPHIVSVFKTRLPDAPVDIYFIDCPYYFKRPYIYSAAPDEDERFILFQKAVIESLQHMNWKPDVIHCNDWPTGLIPLLLKDNYNWDQLFFGKTATVITIHNIAYQGRFPEASLYKAEIRPELFYPNSSIEAWHSFCFLKAGIMYADAINTVSEMYANEITNSEFGVGLEGTLRYRINDFYGILNGIDYTVWNPEVDKNIYFHYSKDDLRGKLENKKALLKQAKLPFNENVPVIGIVSRLVNLKGFNLIAEAIPELMRMNAQWVILGSGEERFENLFRSLSYSFPDKVFSYIGFNDELSHLIEAGADIFLMPSYSEPCGLNQIYSLKYGCVPIVRKTGGLADTVQDWDEEKHYGRETGTGFSFIDYTHQAMISRIKRAIDIYTRDKETWQKIMHNGMSKNFSWDVSAQKYIKLYKKAIENRQNMW
jgi:starch synthase